MRKNVSDLCSSVHVVKSDPKRMEAFNAGICMFN